jgi:hypothetical protein
MLLNAIFRSSLIFCPNASWTYLMRTMAISASFLPSCQSQLTRTELARNTGITTSKRQDAYERIDFNIE